MNYKNGVNSCFLLRAEISEEQKIKAKRIAKKKHMTFSGWVGSLIEREIEKEAQKEEGR